MPLPVLLGVDQDQGALEDVETQAAQRYRHEYRVECLGEAEGALRMLADLARAGEQLALVLVGKGISDTTGGELLERVRQLHPHAKRALLVPSGAWADPPTAEAILDAMALGRIDYYVSRPASSQDEVFHEAVSSFLLEWATDRRIAPRRLRRRAGHCSSPRSTWNPSRNVEPVLGAGTLGRSCHPAQAPHYPLRNAVPISLRAWRAGSGECSRTTPRRRRPRRTTPTNERPASSV